MQAHCVTVANPFAPHVGRTITAIDAPCHIGALAPDISKPFIILRNGQAVLRKDWGRPVIDGDVLAVVVLPQGGGGSNPLRVVAMLAVAIIAPYAASMIAWGVAATSSIAVGQMAALSTALQIGIGMAGSLLVNALIPPPKPPSTQQAAALAAPSPTYNISAQGNTARLDAAIPVQYGRMIAFPDFASAPYVEYYGNEQYLYQLLCLGMGEYDIEQVRIEDTPVANFEEIDYEVIAPGGAVTLFPTNVSTSVEVAGQELLNSGYIGPFVLNPSGTTVNAIGMDVVLPRGLYYVNGSGGLEAITMQVKFEARPIDDDGTPTGAGTYSTLGTETITAKTTTPLRKSYRYDVTSARYEVRATRVDAKETSTSYGDEVVWAGARGYMPTTRAFGNVTLIAMRMRASNNLSQIASRKVNVIATRKLPIYRGTENLITYSEQIDQWAAGSATVAADTAETTDPNGGNTAEKVTGSSAVETTPSKQTTALTAGKTYTASIHVKADTAAFVRIRFNGVSTWFDLSTGATGTQNTDSAGATPLGDGWFRVWVVEQVDSATETLSATPTASDAGTTSSGILYLWGAQINEGEEPAEYVATTTAVYEAWSAETATDSIAWALGDMLRNTDYGAGLSDSRIDLAALYDLDATWTARGDSFNGRFDNTLSMWEAISKVATAGRAKPFMQGGIVRFARDEDKTTPVALYSMRNIARGSFRVDYLIPNDDTSDCIEVGYFDGIYWAPRRVNAALNGSVEARRAKVDLFGVTDREQAYREGLYYCAANSYRRRLISFSTEMEGFIPSIGDLIAIQHDMPGWAQQAEVISAESATNLCLYSENFNDGAEWLVGSSTVVNTTEVVSPVETETADKLTAVTDLRPRQDFTGQLSGNGAFCFSCYVQAGTANEIRMRINGAAVWFDLTAGTILAQNADYAGIEDAGSGWWRVWVAENSIVNEFVEIYSVDYGTSVTAAFGTCYLWGAQLNAGTSPLPYVKTTDEAVSATILTLTEDLTWNTDGVSTHYIGLRRKDGGFDGPYEANWADTNKVSTVGLPFTPYTGTDYERTHITFGWSETWRQEAKVTAIKPRGLYEVQIEAVNEDPSVHTADTGATAPPVETTQLTTLYTAPQIYNLTMRSTTDDVNKALLSWSPAPGADSYQIEMSYGLSQYDTDLEWTRVGETTACSYAVTAIYGGATLIRVRAIGLAVGPWVTMLYGADADYMWDSDSSTLMWDTTTAPGDGSAVNMWSY